MIHNVGYQTYVVHAAYQFVAPSTVNGKVERISEKGDMPVSRISGLQIVAGLVLILCMVSEGYAWDSKKEKPVAVLDLMKQAELAEEAKKACWELTMEERLRTPSGDVAARNYLTLVGMMARKKNEGTMPQWASDMEEAVRGNDSSTCTDISVKEFSNNLMREVLKNGKKSPHKNTEK